jgi:hypothetical protein
MSMGFLKHIDFENQDGVYLPMLNDVSRNHFYDQILTEVRDQHCVEIGFGTGLLSMLALKHGARSIVAYESDTDRYRLGCEVIKVLKLQDRITLINQRYDHTCEHDHTVVFTETVDDNIWGEGLYNSLPRQLGKRFLPGQYFLEIYVVPISADIAGNLIQAHEGHQFSPGVDVDLQFVSYINLLLSKKYNKPIKSKVELPEGGTELTPIPTYIDWVINSTCTGRYVIDANAQFVDDPVCQLQFDTDKQPVLIVPRAGMQHGGNRLYLDTGHWKPSANPAVINAPNSQVIVEHDLRTGKISYKIKEKT